MDDALKKIIGLAWRTVPGATANEAILRARRATAAGEQAAMRGNLDDAEADADGGLAEDDDSAPMARAYEIALAPDATLESFARDHLPKLVYHLESVGAHLPNAHGVVICLFSGDELHFLQAGELIGALCTALSLTPQEMSKRFGTGELRTAIRRDAPQDAPPAVPPDAAPKPSGLMLGPPPKSGEPR